MTATGPLLVESKVWAGPQLDLMPVGSLHVAANGMSDSGDAGDAIGLGGLIAARVHPLVTVGFAPRFVLPVKADGASDSGSQLDLRARGTVGKEVAPRVYLGGIATIGYSMMFHVLSDANQKYYRTAGLIFGFGAGVGYTIGPRLQLVGEVSYQLGYQGTTIQGFRVAAGDNYLTMGVGLVLPVM